MTVRLDDATLLPRETVRFPVELRRPAGFDPEEPATWPRVAGRLEVVEGRLWYMPPCADYQQDVVSDVTFLLRTWSESRPEFVVGSNEAGMVLGGEARGADAAVWRREAAEPRTGRFRRTSPVLSVEVTGEDETEDDLRRKAGWYLAHGVQVVWLVLPATFEVVVVRADSDRRFSLGDSLPAEPALPGLAPAVAQFFIQIRR